MNVSDRARSLLLLAVASASASASACAASPPPTVDAPVQDRGARAAPPEDAPASAEGWLADEALGRALARRTGKPMLINFDAAWCAACREMDRDTFPSPDVQAALRKVVAVSVDVTDDEAPEGARLRKKYGVVGLPTLVILDRNGKEVGRATELVRPNVLAAMQAKAL